MTGDPEILISRRSLMKGAGALLPAMSVQGCVLRDGQQMERHKRFLADVAALLIPRTETPGGDAANVNAHAVALTAIGAGMDGAAPAMIDVLHDALDALCHGAYLDAPLPSRFAAMTKVDRDAFASDKPAEGSLGEAWRKIKGLILFGYYTSKPGASQELRYELVPGRFDSDVPVTDETKAISSDWFAAIFR